MTDKFNPDTHVFGMAYINTDEGDIVYPIGSPDVFNEVNVVVDGELQPVMVCVSTFERAPEHDLIPRSDTPNADDRTQISKERREALETLKLMVQKFNDKADGGLKKIELFAWLSFDAPKLIEALEQTAQPEGDVQKLREALEAAYRYINSSDQELKDEGKSRDWYLGLFHRLCPYLPSPYATAQPAKNVDDLVECLQRIITAWETPMVGMKKSVEAAKAALAKHGETV